MITRLSFLAAVLYSSVTAQYANYLTRPGQHAVVLTVLQNDKPDVLDKNYIWMTPYTTDFDVNAGHYGPHIFDNEGHLVWFGNDSVELRAMNAHICDYQGQIGTHICYNDANPIHGGGHSSGVIRFFDNHYNQVGRDHGARNGLIGPDIHELNTPAGHGGSSFIQDIFQSVEYDLRPYNGPKSGYLLSGCFQEISLYNNTVLFQWCSHDHIAIDETFVYLRGSGNYSDNISGEGTFDRPWDYFHINAIDKDFNGNYLISSRQCHTLYKIAGRYHSNPGSIIWRLDGKNNDFKMEPKGLNFSWQHSARFHENLFSPDTIGIAVFDNGFDGGDGAKSGRISNGLLLEINEKKMTATMRAQYLQPQHKVTPSQGYLQVLQNSNIFMGWGGLPYVSEHLRSGEAIYYAIFGQGSRAPLQSYRSYKLPWVGLPTVPPDILAFSLECTSPERYVFASWNGATEVASWKIETANHTDGPWSQEGGLFRKVSYETRMRIRPATFSLYARVLAMDSSGNLLEHGKSVPRKFFVPNHHIKGNCSESDCTTSIKYDAANSIVDTCIGLD